MGTFIFGFGDCRRIPGLRRYCGYFGQYRTNSVRYFHRSVRRGFGGQRYTRPCPAGATDVTKELPFPALCMAEEWKKRLEILRRFFLGKESGSVQN